MNDPTWAQSEVERQDDRVLEMSRHERLASEFRQEMTSVWTDRAGRELRLRYLDPFGEDTSESKRLLQEQVRALSIAVQAMHRAEPAAQDVSNRLVDAEQLRRQIDLEVESAERAAMVAMESVAAVRMTLQDAHQLLAKIGS